MKKFLFTVILFVWAQLALAGGANLYQVELPAESQSQDLRASLMKKGLLQVLANVSGNTHIEKNAVVKAKLGRADHFVQEYRYIKSTIRIRYNKNAVMAILKKAGALKKVTSPSIAVTLQISNIKQSNEVSAVMSYLEHLESVEKVELTEIAGDLIQLLVSTQGSLDAFQQEISSNQHLVLKSQTIKEKQFTYEWSR